MVADLGAAEMAAAVVSEAAAEDVAVAGFLLEMKVPLLKS